MGRSYVEQVYEWVRSLMGAKDAPDFSGTDAHEGLQSPILWLPFDPNRDDPKA